MKFPLPAFYNPQRVGTVYRVDYASLATLAPNYRQTNGIQPSSTDRQRIWLLLIDVQNTFCIPGFELYVGGRSGNGAVEDNRRLAEFIYHNLGYITHISATMDTHRAQQIFHPVFFVDADGNHPAPYTDIHAADVRAGKWRFNPALASQFGISPEYGQEIILHYTQTLEAKGKYALTIWPYHALLGGIGHALVSAIEEAVFFHSLVRLDQPEFEIKGEQPFTENYSVVGPEVLTGPMDEVLGRRNPKFVEQLQQFDRLYIAGQAKSHCVAWTVADLLEDIQAVDPALAQKVYLLEDCTSPVVVPGVVDHTEAAEAAFAAFAKAGMKIVRSTEAL
ncbi:MAG: isochorismatase [Anaerolineae bacterium]|nr:MAG: isochorismatase [Anaerolineae bacterium]